MDEIQFFVSLPYVKSSTILKCIIVIIIIKKKMRATQPVGSVGFCKYQLKRTQRMRISLCWHRNKMQRRTVSFTFDLITFDYLLKCDQKLYSNIDFCQAASIQMTNTNDDDDKYRHDRGIQGLQHHHT